MGHTQSAQHSFHHHQHHMHRAYRPHGPSPGGGSAGEGSSEAEGDIPRWNTHSFPRDPQRARVLRGHGPGPGPHMQLAPENKVLPVVLGPPPRLRNTDNGNILHNGGTISGRKISQTQIVAPVNVYRSRHEPRGPPGGPPRPSSRGPGSNGGGLSNSRRFGGSEPDLRDPSQRHGPPPGMIMHHHREPSGRTGRSSTTAAAAAAAAARKKYKAPPPPQINGHHHHHPQDSESPSDTTWEDNGSAAIPRRARLFKTRTQTNATSSPAPSSNTRSSRSPRQDDHHQEVKVTRPLNPAAANFLAQKSVSSPEFQHELVRAAQRRHQERMAANKQKQQAPQQPQQHEKVAVLVTSAELKKEQRRGGMSPVPAGPRHAPVGREASGDTREGKDVVVRSTRSRSPVSEGGLKSSGVTRIPVPGPAPLRERPEPQQPPKTFYFGMDVGGGPAPADEDEVERFAARLRDRPSRRGNRRDSGSVGSGASEEEPMQHGDINLQLRPTLPKKTPDIPRFSPTAAWRQLLVGADPSNREQEDSDDEVNNRSRIRPRSSSPVLRGDGSGTAALLEERIVQSYLQRAPLIVAARGSVATHEKSGDSGISGDASPGPGATLLDSPDPAPASSNPRSRQHHASTATRQWTPEQDLDETSSEDEHARSPPSRSPQPRRACSEERPGEAPPFKGERGRSSGRVTPPKFIRRSHMFSLSLPRPDHLQYAATKGIDDPESPIESPSNPEHATSFHSLQKFGRSVSAALGGPGALRSQSHQQLSLDENWYLSRSAPNSLDSSGEGAAAVWGPRALAIHATAVDIDGPSSPELEEIDDENASSPRSSTKQQLSFMAGGSHIMYLPEYDSRRCMMPRVKSNQLHAGQRSLSVDVLNFRSQQEVPLKRMSHEAPAEMKELRPESPWGVEQPSQQQQKTNDTPTVKQVVTKRGKKFTFQSTIRQIERKRIADRLSKEAEQKERQRKHEAEAMRLVEEEFQRKRAREKASLKEQLRLFNLQEPVDGPQSLPVMSSEPLQKSRTRDEPDGASAARSGVSKKKNDEERQPQRTEPREYKDYIASPVKINSRYPSGEQRSSPAPSSPSSGRGGASGAPQQRRNVLHPAAVYDMPKSTQVYVAPHPSNLTVPGPVFVGTSPPRSPDQLNYRREFARGAIPGAGRNSSPASASRVPRAKLAPSPANNSTSAVSPLHYQDSGAANGGAGANNFNSLPPQQTLTTSTPKQLPRLSGLQPQPFGVTRAKGYRPIGFKPPSNVSGGNGAPKSGSSKLAQAVS